MRFHAKDDPIITVLSPGDLVAVGGVAKNVYDNDEDCVLLSFHEGPGTAGEVLEIAIPESCWSSFIKVVSERRVGTIGP